MSRSRDGTWLTTRSPIRNTPLEMSSRPATIRSAVVFPQPDGPTRTMNSPSWIARSSSLTAVVPSGYVFVTWSNVTPATPPPLSSEGDPNPTFAPCEPTARSGAGREVTSAVAAAGTADAFAAPERVTRADRLTAAAAPATGIEPGETAEEVPHAHLAPPFVARRTLRSVAFFSTVAKPTPGR